MGNEKKPAPMEFRAAGSKARGSVPAGEVPAEVPDHRLTVSQYMRRKGVDYATAIDQLTEARLKARRDGGRDAR